MYNAIVVVGPPGSGKGTQAELISKNFGYKHFSTGDIFRALDRKSELGKKVFSLIDTGHLVPPELTVKITMDYIQKNANEDEIIILDGFPRNVPQAKAAEGKIKVIKVLAFVGDLNVFKQRLLKRGQGRTDDTKEVIENRFKVYKRETEPMLNYYNSKIVNKINAEPSVEDIYKEVEKVL